jgi:pSer/pThr/pTyr-binding forkhead associated (FHA) protein
MANLFELVMEEGPEPGLRSELDKPSIILGRDPSSDVVVDDVEVSRRHARLIGQADGFAIEDLGSTNGTFVNGQRIRSVVPLRAGAKIRLGELVSFVYQEVKPDEAATRDFSSTPPSASQRIPHSQRMRAAAPAAPAAEPAPVKAAAPTVEEATSGEEGAPPPRTRRPRRGGIRLPLFSHKWTMGCGIIVAAGLVLGIAFFWYVDANFLWCDVFGGLIPACVP